MKKIRIRETNNGYVVEHEGFLKNNGAYVYDNSRLVTMLLALAEQILDHKVEIVLH